MNSVQPRGGEQEDRRAGIFQLKQESAGVEIAPKAPSSTFPSMSGILIYENDDLMCALLQEWLRGAGYRVRADVSHEGPADLVIVSVCMPKHIGAQQVRKVRTAHPGTPLIAISAHFHSGLPAAGSIARTLGVQQIIAKPLTRGDLLHAVRAVIGPPS